MKLLTLLLRPFLAYGRRGDQRQDRNRHDDNHSFYRMRHTALRRHYCLTIECSQSWRNVTADFDERRAASPHHAPKPACPPPPTLRTYATAGAPPESSRLGHPIRTRRLSGPLSEISYMPQDVCSGVHDFPIVKSTASFASSSTRGV